MNASAKRGEKAIFLTGFRLALPLAGVITKKKRKKYRKGFVLLKTKVFFASECVEWAPIVTVAFINFKEYQYLRFCIVVERA